MPTWTITLADQSTVAVTGTQCTLSYGGLTFKNRDDNISMAFAGTEWRKVEMTVEATDADIADAEHDRADERLILQEVGRCWDAGDPLSIRNAAGRHLPKLMQAGHGMEFGRADKLARHMLKRGDLLERQHGKRLGLAVRGADDR
jgi:hypothetical protein